MRWKLAHILPLFLIISIPLSGQEDPIEKLMTKRYLSCTDIQYNASYLVPEYYGQGNKDTIQAILAFWENRCGPSEEIMRCRIILSIDDGTFTENLYDDRIFSTLYRYQQSLYYLDRRSSYQSYVFIGNLNKFTSNLSTGLLALHKNLSPVEKFFLRWYSDDFENASKMLDSNELNGTKLQEIHLRMKKKQEDAASLHWDIMGGVWIPNGNLDIVGVHPFLGVRGGFAYKRLIVDLTLGFKFIKSPNTYQVYKDGVLWDTRHFSAGMSVLMRLTVLFQRASTDLT